MINSLLDSPLGDAGGYATVGTAILLQVSTTLNIGDINPWITTATAIAGFIFLIYKIKNIKLDNKIKKQKIKRDSDLDISIDKPHKLN